MYRYDEIGRDIIAQLTANGKSIEEIVFVTGNANKVIEMKRMLHIDSIKVTTRDIDLPEIQDSDVLNIVEQKCRSAFDQIVGDGEGDSTSSPSGLRCVMIEDTCLNFNALNGMPGPYIKWFMKAIGNEGLHRLLAGFEDKSAEAVCLYALMTGRDRIFFCRGAVRGRIVEPRGSSWGWDPIFEEHRCSKTFGELGPEEKSKYSHRSSALMVMKKVLC